MIQGTYLEVLCLGTVVADIVSKPVNKFPAKGTLELLDNVELHTGGCAANTGCALAKLGINTGIMGKVGVDGFGDFIINSLKKRSLDVGGIKRDPKTNTAVTLVMVDSGGERTFLHYIGADGTLCKDDLDLNPLDEAKVLHVAGTFLMPEFDGAQTVEILKEARKKGLTISLDTVWDAENRWAKIVEPYFKYVDIFLPSIEEAKRITGKEKVNDIADELLSGGIKIVGIKMGAKGAYVKTEDEEHSIPAFKVNVVDTTGSGDAFVAGFLTGILKEWSLEKTGQFANAVGALCATAMGATKGIRTFDQTLKFIEKQIK